jgi:hypothetical protein
MNHLFNSRDPAMNGNIILMVAAFIASWVALLKAPVTKPFLHPMRFEDRDDALSKSL